MFVYALMSDMQSSPESGPDIDRGMECLCLQIDVESDKIVFQQLRASGAVKTASSEEQTVCQDLGGHGYSVSSQHLSCTQQVLDSPILQQQVNL